MIAVHLSSYYVLSDVPHFQFRYAVTLSIIIGASLSEPHIYELVVHNPYIFFVWYVRHPRAAIDITLTCAI